MKLIYKATGAEVKVGDVVKIDGEKCEVTYFRPPYKPSSSGKVLVKFENRNCNMEYYTSVIGAEWVEREDR
jgi:hypothetical protein